MPFLDEILPATEAEIDAASAQRSVAELKRMIADAPEVNSFADALRNSRGMIAEIKRKSPSAGVMNAENVEKAPAVYAKSPAVKAVSILTNNSHFGMSVDQLSRIRALVRKPILRKDFIIKEYQVYEARAFHADAILLMAKLLSKSRLETLHALARELKMDVLFEVHTREEISRIPADARIYGVNSRNFMDTMRSATDGFRQSLDLSQSGKGHDPSVDLSTFSLVNDLPKGSIRVAESGVNPGKVTAVLNMGYDAVLVGTSLLKGPETIESTLGEFERAIVPGPGRASPAPAAA